MASQIVFAAYKPQEGKEEELKQLIKEHVPTLRKLELITDRPALTVRAQDGTFIEIIEWYDVEAADKAHEHPAVAKIWEQMGAISKFMPLKELPETAKTFLGSSSHF